MNYTIPMHEPVIETDGGPWAVHDYACPVCRERYAILHLNDGVFHPCDKCAAEGWKLSKVKPWWRKVFRGNS